MNRREVILKYITKEKRGIEIGPFYTPLTPKRDGYNCLVMDVFDTATTRKMAADNPSISDEDAKGIEDIDLIGSCTHIEEVVAKCDLGSFDYIVSSHNFEHLPNPIRFLQGCAKVLKPDGMISMAIPDRRACYDYFRPVTRLSDWLDAWLADRSQPTLAQAFDDQWVRANYDQHGSFFHGADPKRISAAMTFEKDFEQWKARRSASDTEYHDAHCSVFTPASFELLLRDCAYLGLVPFEVVDISDSPGVDFFVHLRLSTARAALRPTDYDKIRGRLLHRMLDEASETSLLGFQGKTPPQHRDEDLRRAIEGLTVQLQAAADKRIRSLAGKLSAVYSSRGRKFTEPLRGLVSALRGELAGGNRNG